MLQTDPKELLLLSGIEKTIKGSTSGITEEAKTAAKHFSHMLKTYFLKKKIFFFVKYYDIFTNVFGKIKQGKSAVCYYSVG